uniref:Transposase Tc1-like domain-containing protein n=1 Tax=Esox lucius TaxID=8010 RepID=A0AAY5K3R6_ESOLU
MGYNSRRPHRVPLVSTTNRKKRLQYAQAHQNWTVEDWKIVAWSDESRFLLRHSDGRVRIWRKQNENMDPSCLVTTVQAGGGGVMVWEMFSWHTLGPLVPIGHCLTLWRVRSHQCDQSRVVPGAYDHTGVIRMSCLERTISIPSYK